MLLWLQLAASPMSAEMEAVNSDFRRLAVYVLPMLLLSSCCFVKSRIIALFLLPTSFAAILLVAPEDFVDDLGVGITMITICLTLLAYVTAAGIWLRRRATLDYLVTERSSVRLRKDRWRPYDGLFLPRVVFIVSVFVVTAAAIPILPPLVDRVAISFGVGTGSVPAEFNQGIVLCNLVMFFFWCVLSYSLVVTPVLEIEAQTRQTETSIQASMSRKRKLGGQILLVLMVLVGLAMLVTLISLRQA